MEIKRNSSYGLSHHNLLTACLQAVHSIHLNHQTYEGGLLYFLPLSQWEQIKLAPPSSILHCSLNNGDNH